MLKAKNPKFKERVLEKLKGQAFMRLMGMQIDSIEEGVVRGSVAFTDDLQQQDGIMHGGALATAADIVAGFAAYTLVEETERVVTAEIKISYLRAAKGAKIEAIGKVLKAGSRFSFVESELYAVDGDKRTLVVKANTTMAVI